MGNGLWAKGRGKGQRAMRNGLVALSMAIGVSAVALAEAETGRYGIQAPAPSTIDLGGKLYRAVFISGPGTLSSGDLAAVSEPQRGRLSTFLTRRSSFTSAYENKPQDADAMQSDAKRRVIERAIVALIDAPGINAEAVEFVKAAPIAYEWEGRPEGPLAEAAYAEEVLKKTPKSPLAPFLYVFIAQRQRSAFEAADRAGDEAAMKAAAKQYRAYIERARSASDPIFRLLADDLDRVPYVYTKSEKHPRDYQS
jgi:hypothetical protein